MSNNINWIEEIKTIDPRVKFVRENDEMENQAQNKDGQLTVLKVYSRGDNRGKYYYCQCQCGEKVAVWGSHFRTLHTKSCGCMRKENSKKLMNSLIANNLRYRGYDLTGQTINGFQILEKTGEQNRNKEWVYRALCPVCHQECFKTAKSMKDNLSCGCFHGSVGEEEIKQLLRDNNIPFKHQVTFADCKDKGLLIFDFLVNNSYLIEYDGIQHFEATGGWSTEEHLQQVQRRDNIKNNYCKEKNIPLIRIPYTHTKIIIEDLLLETSEYIIH